MEYDQKKVDEVVLALLHLNSFEEEIGKNLRVTHAWKNLPWNEMGRLYEQGWISNPKGQAKSVVLTEEGKQRSEELFNKLFGLDQQDK